MDRPPDQWAGYVPGSYETATDERTTIKVSECRPTAEGLEISLSWTGTPARAVVWTHSATGSARSEAAKAIPPVFTVRESEATAATGKMAVEAVVFTRNGDHGYDDAAVEAEALVERARRVIESLPSGAVVMSRRRFRAWFSNERRAMRTMIEAYLAPDGGLGDVHRALTSGVSDAFEALRSLALGVGEMTVEAAPSGTLRHPVAVLKSGEATSLERAVTIAALASAGGHKVGIVEDWAADEYFAIAFLGGRSYLLHDPKNGAALSPVVPKEVHGRLTGLPTRAESANSEVGPRMAWLREFAPAPSRGRP
jgi:hypothetical protein